jgi:hypothetical protein
VPRKNRSSLQKWRAHFARIDKLKKEQEELERKRKSKGNSVGGPYKGTVSPTVLKTLQLGAFSMKQSTSIMKGTPSFIRLEYQSTATTS